MSDDRDPELEHMLGRLSGAYPDANTAYVAVTGRVRQVKRRRAFVASSAACIMLIGVGALAVRGGGSDPQQVQPASESSESSNSTPTSTETSAKDDSTSSSEESTSSSQESTSSTDEPTTSADQVSPVTAPSVNTASKTTGGSGSTSSTASNSGSSSSSSSSEATVNVPAGQSTYESIGGKIVVAVTDGALSLVSDSPADGFTTNVKHNRPDRVEVEFRDGSTTWRIRVDLVNGVAVVQTTQH